MKRFICLALAILMCFSATLALTACDDDHTHSYGEWETTVAATCGTKGVRSRHCDCGYVQTEEIAVTGTHTYGEWETTVAATCGTKGVRMRRCDCGEVQTEEISATGLHAYGEWETVVEATCITKGMRMHVCACGCFETEEIPVTSTHTVDGNGTCSVCNHTHSYGEWETVMQETCTTKGWRVHSCACGASEMQEIPATGIHSFGQWQELVASTCAKKGLAARICSCGYFQKKALAESNNHAYQNGVCTVCGTNDLPEGVEIDSDGKRWKKDEWGDWREYDDLPESLDYDGEIITFLYWTGGSTVKPEFVQSEEVDDTLLSSIYERNRAIQSRLDVEFNFIAEPGDSSQRASFIARVQRAKDAGTHDFDLIGSYAPNAGSLLVAGLVQNITAVDCNYINLDKPWWPKNLTQNLAIANNLYFVSGDCSTNTMYQMIGVFFNKDLVNKRYKQEAEAYFASNLHVKTPQSGAGGGNTATNMIYEKVYAGKWTLDEFIYLASNTYVDKYGDGVTVDDTFGVAGNENVFSSFYGGSNLRIIEHTADGSVMKISDDWTSSKTVRLVAKLHTLLGTNSYHGNYATGKTWNRPFYYGTTYFMVGYMRQAEDSLAHNDKIPNYGILPTPKYDLNQKNYYTTIGNEFSIYSIFVDFDARGNAQETLSMLTAVLECWGSEAYRKTTPVISRRLKSSSLQCEADLYEIIRTSVEVDLGRVLRSALAGSVTGAYPADYIAIRAAVSGTSWTAQYSPDLSRIQNNLAKFVEDLKWSLVDTQ